MHTDMHADMHTRTVEVPVIYLFFPVLTRRFSEFSRYVHSRQNALSTDKRCATSELTGKQNRSVLPTSRRPTEKKD